MKKRTRNKIATAILIVVIMAAFGSVMSTAGLLMIYMRQENRRHDMAQAIHQMFESAGEEENGATGWLEENIHTELGLVTQTLRSFDTADGYQGPREFENGFVIEFADGKQLVPEGSYRKITDLQGQPLHFTEEEILKGMSDLIVNREPVLVGGNTYENSAAIRFAAIRDHLYYGSLIYETEIDHYLKLYSDYWDALSNLEKTYRTAILVVECTEPENLMILNNSSYFPDAEYAEEIGISYEMLEEGDFQLEKDGTQYGCTALLQKNDGYAVIVAEPQIDVMSQSILRSVITFSVVLLLLVSFAVWLTSVKDYVREFILSEMAAHQYDPHRVRSVCIAAALIGTVFVFCAGTFQEQLGILQDEYTNGKKALDTLFYWIDENETSKKADMVETEEAWLARYARHAADFISEYPELEEEETLDRFCQAMNADYMILFDEDGKEILTNSGYKGLKLYDGNTAGMSAFRKLLYGEPSVVLSEEESSEVIGGDGHQFVGVTVQRGGDRNGALAVAFRSGRTTRTRDYFDLQSRMNYLFTPTQICLTVDPADGQISYASDPGLTGLDAVRLGLKTDASHNGNLNYFKIDGNGYYGFSTEHNDLIYYFGADSREILRGSLPYGILAAIGFLFAFLLTALSLMKGYTRQVFERDAVIGKPVAKGPVIEILSPDGRVRRTVDPSRRWAFEFNRWSDLTPEKRTEVVFFSILFALILLYLRMSQYFGTSYGNRDLLGFIFHGDWTRGFNLFALSAVVLIVMISCMSVALVKIVLQLLCRNMNAKGETVCRLIFSFIQYAAVFIALYYAFGYLGFNTTAIVASLGLVSLALSIGSRDMVADILAGITIVFEGEFQVGDIIEIEGFRGTVQEIGVRTTKLIGEGDNIRIVGNRDIKNVTNMTRLNSWYTLSLSLPVTESIHHIETVLEQNLDAVGKGCPVIISGPYFKGVTDLDSTQMTIQINAECREQDLESVRRYLNRELRDLFAREKIIFIE